MELNPHKKLKGVLTGNCSKCGYLFNIKCKDLEIMSRDTTLTCPKCGNREHLQND